MGVLAGTAVDGRYFLCGDFGVYVKGCAAGIIGWLCADLHLHIRAVGAVHGNLVFCAYRRPIAVFLGLALGIWAYKSNKVEAALTPLLNVAQTMPHFSYLVPVTVLFGLGDHAGAIATVIFATPPMVRLTMLGLKKVPPEVKEAGMMSGCDKFQLLFRVLLPTARHDI